MPFDLTCFVQAMVTLPGHAALLSRACEAAAEVSGKPAFAAHVLPGRPWEHATLAASGPHDPPLPAAVRSALFAVHRRVSLAAEMLVVQRDAETESIFRALATQGCTALVVIPLRNRGGRLSGSLTTAADGDVDTLRTIASLTGPAMEAAWLHTLARRDQERLQLFSETTEESLWDWDIALDEVWWGGNLEQLFGGRVRVSRRPDWRHARIHPEDVDRVISSLETALAASDSSWSAQYRLRAASDDFVHVREHVYFLREVDGRPYRAIGTVRDVSALEQSLRSEMQARATAERASVVKDEFLAMLGHELRNPLAPMVTAITLLERQVGDPEQSLAILRRQTQHLVRLVDDLLDVSRISSGKIDLEKQRTSAATLVQRALEMVQPLMAQRRHEVAVDIAPDLELDVDPARMTQVLSNLLANAAKYTEPGARVHVTAQAQDDVAVIRIRDNGIGLAPAFLPTIFQMFTQGPQALDRAQGGLGLGLSIVANIVKLHGGRVEALSDGLGRGTEIVVRLPRAADIARQPGDASAKPPSRVPPQDVLVVDDNEDAAAMLEALLSASGHVVRIAHHPDEAQRLFDERHPEIALIDIGLPSIDGYELVRRLRLSADAAKTTFVALTGYGLASDKARALDAGFAAHVAKPVSLETLEKLIERWRR